MNINIISRFIQGLSALLILVLVFAVCAEDSNVNTNAVVWVSCMLIGVSTIVEFCKDLKEPGSDKYP
jgi:hypothetical protein